MFEKIKKLRESRAALVAKMRELAGGAESDSGMTAEQRQAFDAAKKDFDAQGKELTELENQRDADLQRSKAAQEAAEAMSRHDDRLTSPVKPGRTDRKDTEEDPEGPVSVRRCRSGDREVIRIQMRESRRFVDIPVDNAEMVARTTPEYCRQFARALEGRGYDANDSVKGGYLVPSIQFVMELIDQVRDEVHMRRLCRVLPPTSAKSLGAPTRTKKGSYFKWGQMLSAAEEASTDNSEFGARILEPHWITGIVESDRAFLASGIMSPETIIREDIALGLGEYEEQAFLTGDGQEKPLGIFTASANGIPTSRDVSTGNEATTPKFDGLITAKYSLKGKYRDQASWIFHRDTIAKITLLKDGNGQYIWQPSVQVGQPDRVLNLPVTESEKAPNTFTSGLYVGILGAFQYYWIADHVDMQMQRRVEVKAGSNKDDWIIRRRVDGMPVLAEAFARVKLP